MSVSSFPFVCFLCGLHIWQLTCHVYNIIELFFCSKVTTFGTFAKLYNYNPSTIPLCNRYRFLEIRYHRPEETHKGRVLPARVETVVIFVPDVWHLLPTRVEWESTIAAYKKELAEKVANIGEIKKESSGAEELQALHHYYITLY